MTITEYLINFALVGLVVVQLRGRRLSRANLLLPVVIVVWVASNLLRNVPTAGNDLILEVAGALAGVTLGALAAAATRISTDEHGSAVAKAGAAAAVLWILGIGARIAFSLYAQHGGAPSIAHFSAAHHITSGGAWVAAFVLMALTEVVARTAVVILKAHRSGARLPRRALSGSPAVA
ncbi:MAG TPA: hypothetical protein VFA11_13090 [Acidimicrobiales bacterium]|nr:hypothetical protein [Acidimicrobiales bacterium]